MLVCVTGESRYIASWLVKMLLQRDYTVNATELSLGLFLTLFLFIYFSSFCVSCYVDLHCTGQLSCSI